MMDRATIWYIFGIAASLILAHRLRVMQKGTFRDPVSVSFTSGVLFCIFGVLSKQPVVAAIIDAQLGLNAAWLLADAFFLSGLCALTYWIDMMGKPTLKQQRWGLLKSWRLPLLIAVIGWMVITALSQATTWQLLERGGPNVSGNGLLLSNRLAYFSYDIWGLAYLSYQFYRLRKQMRDRVSYLRLTMAWMAVTIALIAPVLQLLATIEIFVIPALVTTIWPPLWQIVSLIQGVVALLMLIIFFEPGYRLVSWVDKQILVQRLRLTRKVIAALRASQGNRPSLPLTEAQWSLKPDRQLATLVNEIEIMAVAPDMSRQTIAAPAGCVMPKSLRDELHKQQQLLKQALKTNETIVFATMSGDTYSLARWYAHFGQFRRTRAVVNRR